MLANVQSVSVPVIQALNNGGLPYAVLWGTQTAVTTALAVTMAALWLRLRQPVMRALAMHWLARLAVVLVNLVYYLSGDPSRPQLMPFAAFFGMACGTLFLTAWQIAREAAPADDTVPPAAPWGPVLAVFTALAVIAHVVNVYHFGFSAGVAAVWTRGLHAIAYSSFLGWLVTRWFAHPAARHRLSPLVIGVTLSLGFDAIDAVRRWLVLSGDTPVGGPVLTIVGSITGTLCLGLGMLLAALESERDALRQRADALRLAQQEQADSRRLQSLGQLAGGVAHDFNNVLGLIINGIDFVESALHRDQDDVRGDLRQMRAAAERGAALTRRLLGLARPRGEEPVRVAPAAVLREDLPMLQRLLSSRMTLQAHVSGAAEVCMNRTELEQVVINLLVNARDATPGSGVVRLVLDEQTVGREATARLGRITAGHWVRLSVIDDGVGIEPEAMPSLFEPFFTTKGDSGTGFGLATVAAAVREARGAVDVFSAPGHGTRFDVWLPAATPAGFPT